MGDERVWFCPQCGMIGPEMTTIDEDGCCCICGATCCRESELRKLLKNAGLDICTAAERRVLEACERLDEKHLRLMASGAWCGHGKDIGLAELARREEKPHG